MTYTIEREGIAVERGLTLAEAADYLMQADGFAYELRPVGEWLELWLADGSAASTRSARHLVKSVFVGTTRRAAYEWAVGQEWRGYRAVPDAEFDRIAAEAEADETGGTDR